MTGFRRDGHICKVNIYYVYHSRIILFLLLVASYYYVLLNIELNLFQ